MEIIGYEGLYWIFENGKITNKKGEEKKSFVVGNYKQIKLHKNGGWNYYYIHRLLMKHFKPNEYDETLQIDHINRIRTDNRLENLRCVSHSNNQHNKNIAKNNTSGEKYINYIKKSKRWKFTKTINKKLHAKYFKTLEEAVLYKKTYLEQNNLTI